MKDELAIETTQIKQANLDLFLSLAAYKYKYSQQVLNYFPLVLSCYKSVVLGHSCQDFDHLILSPLSKRYLINQSFTICQNIKKMHCKQA